MSEKKIIDFETLGRVINIFKLAPEINLNDVFDELPKPTLSDVCGTRTLDSMTEEEVREVATLTGLYEDNVEIIDRNVRCIEFIYYSRGPMQDDYSESHGVIRIGTIEVYGDILKPVAVIKWFIEKGFNVFGGER